ncbi:MAG: MCE family protein, partial [Pseudomonadota bacterium]
APQLLDRVSTLTERLTLVLSDENLSQIGGILEHLEVVTAALADNDEEIAGTLRSARAALENASRAADQIATLAGTSNALIEENGAPTMAQLQATLAQADATLAKLEGTANETNRTLVHVQAQTLPEVDLLLRDLRLVSSSLGAVAAKLDEDPAGAILGGRTLPAYDPEARQ